jgi:hypothetical protein
MSKKKKTKRAKYPHVVKKDYIEALGNKIFTTSPSERIVYNTLMDVYKTGYNEGYKRKHEEVCRFRDKQRQHLDADFKQFRDDLEDIIHIKNIKS